MEYISFFLGDPHTDPNAVTDAFKTLFIGRLVSTLLTVRTKFNKKYGGYFVNQCYFIIPLVFL